MHIRSFYKIFSIKLGIAVILCFALCLTCFLVEQGQQKRNIKLANKEKLIQLKWTTPTGSMKASSQLYDLQEGSGQHYATETNQKLAARKDNHLNDIESQANANKDYEHGRLLPAINFRLNDNLPVSSTVMPNHIQKQTNGKQTDNQDNIEPTLTMLTEKPEPLKLSTLQFAVSLEENGDIFADATMSTTTKKYASDRFFSNEFELDIYSKFSSADSSDEVDEDQDQDQEQNHYDLNIEEDDDADFITFQQTTSKQPKDLIAISPPPPSTAWINSLLNNVPQILVPFSEPRLYAIDNQIPKYPEHMFLESSDVKPIWKKKSKILHTTPTMNSLLANNNALGNWFTRPDDGLKSLNKIFQGLWSKKN